MTTNRKNRLRSVALAVLFALSLLIPQAARGGEVALNVGYGFLGSPSPFVEVSFSSGKRVAFDFNGGVVFADPKDLRFSEFGKMLPIEEKIKNVRTTKGTQLYSVGLDVRVFVRKFGKKHNGYLGAGTDWLPQLETYYPGVKVIAGYQIAVLKKRNLIMRAGSEYYFYGVIPANSFALTSSLGYRF